MQEKILGQKVLRNENAVSFHVNLFEIFDL